MVRDRWCHWLVHSGKRLVLPEGVRAVVFGREPTECHNYYENIVYLSREVTMKQAREIFGQQILLEHAGGIVSMRLALRLFGEGGAWSDSFDYIDKF